MVLDGSKSMSMMLEFEFEVTIRLMKGNQTRSALTDEIAQAFFMRSS